MNVIVKQFDSFGMRLFLFLLFGGVFALVLSTLQLPLRVLASCLVVFGLSTMPGHCAMYPLFYQQRRFLEGFIWGSISGTAFGALLISIVVYTAGWNIPLIFAVVVLVPVVVTAGLFLQKPISAARAGQEQSLAILFCVLIICTFFFYFPYKNLGTLMEGKHIYTWLFGHDFINRQVHVLSLSRALPLESYFFAGEKLSYYWLAYVYPALLYKLFPAQLSIQQALQLTLLLYGIFIASGFYLTFNHFIKEQKVLVVVLLMTVLCYSYMDMYNFAVGLYKSTGPEAASAALVRSLGNFAGFSHSLYRFFMVEPQGILAIGIMLLMIVVYNNRSAGLYAYGIFGLLLGTVFGIEATMGIILAVWALCVATYSTILNRHDPRQRLGPYVFSAFVAGLVYLCFFAIEMYSFRAGQGVLQVKANWFPLFSAPLYFLLEYGPAFVFGIAGLIEIIRRKERPDHYIHQFIILLAVSLFFVFFIVNPTESQFGLLKATRIIPLCLLMLAAYYLQRTTSFMRRKWVVALILLAALPTYFSDNRIASDINDVRSTYIRSADLSTCQWIKKNLPLKAVVQAEPNYPGTDGKYVPSYYYSLVPIFAERRTGMGEWKVSSQEHSKAGSIGERFHDIKRMFSTTDVHDSVRILRKYGIDYVYVGKLEQTMYGQGLRKFKENRDVFKKVYSLSDIEIYEFIPSGDAGNRS